MLNSFKDLNRTRQADILKLTFLKVTLQMY